jgi:hypothetical protein
MSGHLRNLALAIFIAVQSLAFSIPAFSSNRTALSDAAFKSFSSHLDSIEKGKHAAAAMAEIAVARKMIKDGRLLFREGSLRKSAIIAERLPVQITLIKALIGIEIALHDAEHIESELRAMRRYIEILQVRYTEILSKIHPARRGEKK